MVSQLLITLMSIPFMKRDAFSLTSFTSLIQSILSCVGLFFVIFVIKALTENVIIRFMASVALGGCVYFALLIIQKNRFIMQAFDSLTEKIKSKKN